MRPMRAFLLAFLVACGGGNKPVPKTPEPTPDPIPKTAGPDCKAVAEHVVTVMFAEHPDDQAKAGDAIRSHCDSDKWSDEARSCLATMQNEDEGKGCAKMLTKEQHEAVMAAVDMKHHDAAMAPTAPPASAPPPPPGRTTRGAQPKPKGPAKTGDPCQGGE